MNDIVVLRLPALHSTPLTEAELRGELRGLSGDGATIRGGFQRLAKLGKIKYFGGVLCSQFCNFCEYELSLRISHH